MLTHEQVSRTVLTMKICTHSVLSLGIVTQYQTGQAMCKRYLQHSLTQRTTLDLELAPVYYMLGKQPTIELHPQRTTCSQYYTAYFDCCHSLLHIWHDCLLTHALILIHTKIQSKSTNWYLCSLSSLWFSIYNNGH